MKAILIILFLFLSNSAFSQSDDRWEYITFSNEGNLWYVDTETILTNGNGAINCWIKVVTKDEVFDGKIVEKILFNNEYNCKNKLMKQLSAVFYFKNGEVNDVDMEESIETLTPDSIGESVLKFICKKY